MGTEAVKSTAFVGGGVLGRLILIALAVVVLASGPAAASGNHGPYVADVVHEPHLPARGEEVRVAVTIEPDAAVASVLLTHCRVDPTYACRSEADAMQAGSDGVWVGSIRWDPRFMESGTTTIGYNLVVELENGSRAKAPTASVPAPPDALPEDAGAYYFYTLASQPEAPAPVLPWVAIALILGGLFRVRHRA
jgi:hypothetical protein